MSSSSPHGDPVVRGAREIHHRAGSGDGGGQEDSVGRTKGRRHRRPGCRRHLRSRYAGLDTPAAQAARRHGQGVGRRGDRARLSDLHEADGCLVARWETVDDPEEERRRSRCAHAIGGVHVRILCEAQQEGAGRAAAVTFEHGFGRPAGGYHRRASESQARRAPGRAGDRRHRNASSMWSPRPMPRSRCSDREADPRPRQAADGEIAARVLSQ